MVEKWLSLILIFLIGGTLLYVFAFKVVPSFMNRK